MAEITDIEENEEQEGAEGVESEESTGGDPEVDAQEVIVDEDDGEIDEDAPQYCNGLFITGKASDFTQNPKYSDEYLKQKGLFKEDEEE